MSYRELLTLWAGENPIKTIKLQFLLLTNAVLAVALVLGGGVTPAAWPAGAAGVLLNLVWLLSIARTVLFQKVWQRRLRELAAAHPGEPRFHIHDTRPVLAEIRREDRWLAACGAVSSRYYLVATPLLFCLAWAAALAGVLAGASS